MLLRHAIPRRICARSLPPALTPWISPFNHPRIQRRGAATEGGFGATEPATATQNDLDFSPKDDIVSLAEKELHKLSLNDLIRFGRPPLPAQALLKSARFTREALPIRLSRRIVALRNLPYIIVSNPHISSIFENYQHSLRTILSFPRNHPTTLAEELDFTELLTTIVQTHQNTIPTLARGFLECRRYTTPIEVTTFLDQHLRERIGTRLMAEQHIALHLASTKSPDKLDSENLTNLVNDSYIGCIDTALQPAKIIQSCASFVGDICELRYGVRPQIKIDGDPDVTFPYIPVHLEYILTELLKNAFRATVESGSTTPVYITIAKNPYREGISMRIRDCGGGIAPENLENIWSYSFTTFDEDEGRNDDVLGRFNDAAGGADGSTIAGLGYGLPLSRAYAEYFGGSLTLQTSYGWGTDVYLKLKGVDVGAL
ncbi:alpha-ketoacid dehydrogenase kinase [Ascodesmis nigricans]|uniref:Protein-serine/threonine kinase n=1 Tax=Ascodesmis nigricans TaxID=341454 RepID=A0A4S2MK20_9PEZI|nr:alpha-ketoacid dehydrogenase kinase [Ascodesmis nigricans]